MRCVAIFVPFVLVMGTAHAAPPRALGFYCVTGKSTTSQETISMCYPALSRCREARSTLAGNGFRFAKCKRRKQAHCFGVFGPTGEAAEVCAATADHCETFSDRKDTPCRKQSVPGHAFNGRGFHCAYRDAKNSVGRTECHRTQMFCQARVEETARFNAFARRQAALDKKKGGKVAEAALHLEASLLDWQGCRAKRQAFCFWYAEDGNAVERCTEDPGDCGGMRALMLELGQNPPLSECVRKP